MNGELTYLYGDITKRDAATRTVSGYVSSGAMDVQGQIVDPAWLAGQLPPWMADYGNIREQHNPLRAVGKAKQLDLTTQPGPLLSVKIVDADAWEKVQEGVYNGFSVGITNPVIVKDAVAPRGRIVGGQLIEVSIVDRPANDAARFVLAKAAGALAWQDVQSKAVIEIVKCALPGCDCSCAPGAPDPDCDCSCDYCQSVLPDDDAGSMEQDPDDLAKAAAVGTRTYTSKQRKALAAKGLAMPDGSYPTDGIPALKRAIKAFGRAASDELKAYLVKRAKALNATDLLPADWPGSTKPKEATVMAADTTKAGMLPGHPFTGGHEHEHSNDGDLHTHPHDHDNDGDHDHAHTGGMHEAAATPDVTKARMPKSEPNHAHPFKGAHNHEHDDQRGGTHTHAHLHDDDDMHDHPHLAGKDARLLSPEDRQQAQALNSAYFAATPDVTKAAPDVAAANTVTPPKRPAPLGSALVTVLRDALQRAEALADETDRDRDGDVDTPANMANARPAKPAADFVEGLAPDGTSVETAQSLSLTFAAEADLAKYVDAHIAAALATSGVATVDTVTRSLDSVPAVAEAAATTARGLAALADQTKAAIADLHVTKAALAETQAALEAVKRLAQPVKGVSVVVNKGIGLEPDTIQAAGGTPPTPEQHIEALAEKVVHLTEAQRMALAGKVVNAQYQAQR